jgi:predicted glutamine amidotransferase
VCGIFGFIGNIPQNYKVESFDLLKFIFMQSNIRGKDAAGFSAVHSQDSSPLVTEKRPIASEKFVASCSRFKALRSAMPHIFIGHTRQATTGKPNRGRNNHPFNSNRYSMVHNGHITGWDDLAKKHPIKMRTETDSEVILHLISEKEDIFDGFQHMTDTVDKNSKIATAILQYKSPHRLYLFRTNNPIWTMTIDAWATMYFASTEGILNDALKAMYGQTAYSDKKKAYGITIQEIPSWKVYEIGFGEDDKVKLFKEVDISQPKLGFATKTSTTTTSPTTTNPATPSLPAAAAGYQNGAVAPAARVGMGATETTLRDLANAQKSAVSIVADAVSGFSSVLASITNNPHMSVEEMEMYKKWAYDGRL